MNIYQTFEWLVDRSNRLTEAEAEVERLRVLAVKLALRLAAHTTREQIRTEMEGLNIPAEIWNIRFKDD